MRFKNDSKSCNLYNIVVNYSTCQLPYIFKHNFFNVKSSSSFELFLGMASSITLIILKIYICVNSLRQSKDICREFVLRPASVTIPYHNSCQCLNLLVLSATRRISSLHSSLSPAIHTPNKRRILVERRARQEVAERWRHYTDRRSSFHENST